MSERPPRIETPEQIPEITSKKEYIALATELAKSGEIMPFSSISSLTERADQKLRAEEQEFPGLITPLDTIKRRFETEGMIVVLGEDAQNAFLMPALGGDIEMDSLRPQHLNHHVIRHPKLKALVMAEQNWSSLT